MKNTYVENLFLSHIDATTHHRHTITVAAFTDSKSASRHKTHARKEKWRSLSPETIARARWRKRKREHRAACNSKLKEPENDDTFEDNEDDDDLDLDPPQNHLETDDDPHNNSGYRANQMSREKESEKLVDGGLRICEFPIAIKRVVSRPHSLVLGIVDAERAARNGESGGQGQVGVARLENISYGQLQALSAVPRDSPALLGAPTEETESGGGSGPHVIMPPRIIAGNGVSKRLGSAGRVHVVPVHSDWFSPSSVHRLERQVVPHFFSGKSADHTPEKYMEARNFIVAKYMENPEKHLSVADCQGLVAGIDIDDLTRIVRFLDHWGIINYCARPLKNEAHKDETYLYEDSNGELRVPSAALKSVDSLIQFDKPKCRLKAADAYPELARRHEEDSDFDITIREQLSEHQCHYCSRPIPTVCYQSQKEADVLLCLDCFHEGRFVAGHSSLDFLKVNSMKDYGDGDGDGDSWSDQETLLLLEGMQLYNENWNKIAEHVAFLASTLGPRVAAACSHASLASLSKDADGGKEGSPHGDITNSSKKNGSSSQNDEEAVTLSAEKVKAAAKDGLAAAAVKAKLFADHEEREIQRLSANIVNHQYLSDYESDDNFEVDNWSDDGFTNETLENSSSNKEFRVPDDPTERPKLEKGLKRLELKLKQFAEVETLLMRECEQMERTRQRITSERALMTPPQFVSTGVSRPMGPPGIGALNTGNSRQQVSGAQNPPSIPGYGNSQYIHPHMHQPGMYGHGPRFPLSAIQPSSSASNSNSVFGPTSNSQSSLGHSMLRPVAGTKSARSSAASPKPNSTSGMMKGEAATPISRAAAPDIQQQEAAAQGRLQRPGANNQQQRCTNRHAAARDGPERGLSYFWAVLTQIQGFRLINKPRRHKVVTRLPRPEWRVGIMKLRLICSALHGQVYPIAIPIITRNMEYNLERKPSEEIFFRRKKTYVT
ncbi:hypothetical protein DH2020_007182 [Rehmannia glutinosa]|uniref:SWI/SNF complex subunit SWI3C n=1 Tax=Rehmannia glutinosa TaxID=99300 RepID=A0ABR0TXG1_REHGL